jgi:ribosome maturation factor RimP
MISDKYIRRLSEQFLEGSDRFLVEAKVKPGNKVYVFVDGDTPVNIHDCVELSRFLEKNLEESGEEFELMVSSSGADQPFRVPRQYKKYVGKDIYVVLKDGKKQTGKLLELSETGIKFLPAPSGKKKDIAPELPLDLSFAEIVEAKCVISFK